jgi:hypothetical protein
MEEKLYPLPSFLALKPCQASTNPLIPHPQLSFGLPLFGRVPSFAIRNLLSAFSIDSNAILC